MTQAEVQAALQRLTDNQVVQGEMLGRLERIVERNAEAIGQNAEAIGRLTGRVQVMESAMERLFTEMDRFLRGLGRDGHERETE
jgi:histone H3/H4